MAIAAKEAIRFPLKTVFALGGAGIGALAVHQFDVSYAHSILSYATVFSANHLMAGDFSTQTLEASLGVVPYATGVIIGGSAGVAVAKKILGEPIFG